MLGIGPMSVNCVKVAILASNQLGKSLFFIASRRQIECRSLGGGYVNGWCTETFSKFVKTLDGYDPD